MKETKVKKRKENESNNAKKLGLILPYRARIIGRHLSADPLCSLD